MDIKCAAYLSLGARSHDADGLEIVIDFSGMRISYFKNKVKSVLSTKVLALKSGFNDSSDIARASCLSER